MKKPTSKKKIREQVEAGLPPTGRTDSRWDSPPTKPIHVEMTASVSDLPKDTDSLLFTQPTVLTVSIGDASNPDQHPPTNAVAEKMQEMKSDMKAEGDRIIEASLKQIERDKNPVTVGIGNFVASAVEVPVAISPTAEVKAAAPSFVEREIEKHPVPGSPYTVRESDYSKKLGRPRDIVRAARLDKLKCGLHWTEISHTIFLTQEATQILDQHFMGEAGESAAENGVKLAIVNRVNLPNKRMVTATLAGQPVYVAVWDATMYIPGMEIPVRHDGGPRKDCFVTTKQPRRKGVL